MRGSYALRKVKTYHHDTKPIGPSRRVDMEDIKKKVAHSRAHKHTYINGYVYLVV